MAINFANMLGAASLGEDADGQLLEQRIRNSYVGQFESAVIHLDGRVELFFRGIEPVMLEDLLELQNIAAQLVNTARINWGHEHSKKWQAHR